MYRNNRLEVQRSEGDKLGMASQVDTVVMDIQERNVVMKDVEYLQ